MVYILLTGINYQLPGRPVRVIEFGSVNPKVSWALRDSLANMPLVGLKPLGCTE